MATEHENMLCVPISSLQEGETAPEPGEEIEATIKGVVAHVEGENAYIHVSSVNETTAPPAGAEEPNGDEGDDVRAQTQQSDQEEPQ